MTRATLEGRLPEQLVVVEPGEWRVQEVLRAVAKAAGIPLEIRPDRHFFATRDEFAGHARGRKQLRLEYLEDAVGQTLKYGDAHHIQRLMVTGLFALLVGVYPRRVHEWYLAVYVDAVEWVELPNTLGMTQFADGGVMASKPYCATGAYLDRMSDACKGCRYDPKKATGPDACPFTTLYWDFLARHETLLARNQRMTLQLKNLTRKSAADVRAIRRHADDFRGQVS